jgi:medium-chain acyl-[acyl-carrier-protein] hydrolase
MKYFFENPFLVPLSVNPRPEIRLFCFHCAGGGASFFRSWVKNLSSSVEIIGIQLPGREGRFLEKPYYYLEEAIHSLMSVLPSYLGIPFIFFGHSLGALLAFESARALRVGGYPLPCHLIVSGAKGPHLPSQKKKIHHLKDTDFISEVLSYNGIPALFLNNTELLDLFIPTMKADFAMLENYSYRNDTPLECPISSFGGMDDPYVGINELSSWVTQTIDGFECHTFEGDHFFLENRSEKGVLRIIDSIIYRYLQKHGKKERSSP